MSLFPYLCFSVIFCALVMVVMGSTGRGGRIVPIILIVGEVFLLLAIEDVIDIPFGSDDWIRSFVCVGMAIAALADLMRQGEKAFALLAVFTTLTQMLISLGVIGGVSI